MKIYTELNDEHKYLSLALGFFDGIHLGHREVIKNTVDYANKNGLKSAVITFSSHPAQKFNPNFEGYIMPPDKRFEYFEKLGVDFCWALDFEKIMNIEAESYIKDILIKNFTPKAITSGFNHNFGKNKGGTTALLEEFSHKFDYEYFEIPPVIINDVTVSSSAIREFIRQGDIENLNNFLGRKFSVSGNVIHGQKTGTKLGFKTANIPYRADCVKLKFGVYGGNVRIEDEIYKGIANFGIKPTICSNCEPLLEVHILDFNEEIYGEAITVEFEKFIRAEKKFTSIGELVRQIENDMRSA